MKVAVCNIYRGGTFESHNIPQDSNCIYIYKFLQYLWQFLCTGGYFWRLIFCNAKHHQKARCLKLKTVGKTSGNVCVCVCLRPPDRMVCPNHEVVDF